MKQEKNRIDILKEFEDAPDGAWFSQKVLAALRDCSTSLLERERWLGAGVRFVKQGHLVRYRKQDILEWFNSHKSVQSTSEMAA